MAYGHSVEDILHRLGNPQGNLARYCFESAVRQIKDKPTFDILLALAIFATDASRESLGIVAGFENDLLSRDEGLVELEKLSLANKKTGRFYLLPLTKAYALSLCDDEQTFRSRQVEYYLNFCKKYGGSTKNWENFSQIDLERVNLIETLEWCAQKQLWQSLVDINDQLMGYWELRGYWSTQERWCQFAQIAFTKINVKSQPDVNNKKKKGRCHLAICWIRINQDRFDVARDEASQAIEIFNEIKDLHHVAVARRHLGMIEKLSGGIAKSSGDSELAKQHFDQAEKHYNIALKIWQEEVNDQREMSSILANLGHLWIAQEDYDRAQNYLCQALSIRREIKDKSRISTTLRGLGQLEERSGKLAKSSGNSDLARQHFDTAISYYSEALSIANEVGDKLSAGRAALELGELNFEQGQLKLALKQISQAEDYFMSLNKTSDIDRDVERTQSLLMKLRPLKAKI